MTEEPADPTSRALECGDESPLFKNRPAPLAPGDSAQGQPKKPWPHAPVHKLSEHGVYMVTAGTLHKERLFRDGERLGLLERNVLEFANRYRWQVEAWAVFGNHYHFIARGQPDSDSLRKFITHLHADTARALKRLDESEGRRVWFNFWDTRLTFERSYLARLNYVHQNAVKHGLVVAANQYPWCSAAWFERVVTPALVQTIYSFRTDKLEVPDDF